VTRKAWVGQFGAEAALAFAVGAMWFAVSTVLGTTLPHALLIILGVVVLDVLVVLTVAHFWGIAHAVTVGVASVVALDWYYIPPVHPSAVPDLENSVALAAYLLTGVLLGELAVTARRRADVSEGARSELAGEHAALRRVATLVARQTSPAEVFATVTEEVGRLLTIDITTMLRYETDGTAKVVAAWSESGRHIPLGTRVRLDGENVAATVLRTGRPARIDDLASCSGSLADALRDLGVRSSAGSPITVDGRLWGVMVAASLSTEPIPAGTESRLGEFTELAATAVANAETSAELTASRARIVASGDEARRHIQRDLHDGVQQRLVSLALDLRTAEELAHGAPGDLLPRLSLVREGLIGALDDLREVSHGIHPANLSEGGLRPALSTLARRSAVPIELDIRGPDRLPEPVEVGVYYVVSEAVTNVIKHARASVVHVDLETDDAITRLRVRDDGVGGADPGRGSGLVGLRDRVHALGGRIEITSPSGSGTSLLVSLPLGS
jgi:signal transduction histidine kinase